MDADEIVKVCSKLSLSDDVGDVPNWTIGGSSQKTGLEKVAHSLVGRIITNKDVNREAVRSLLPRIWKTTKEVEIELIGQNTFVFQFKCQWDKKRILESGPWTFDKQLLVLKEATGIGRIQDSNFHLTTMWIQMLNLPLACMHKEAGLELGRLIGRVIEVDCGPNGNCLGKYLRARTEIDITKPLMRGLKVNLGSPAETCVIPIRYERLPNFCYFCGLVGHLVRECPLNVKNILDEDQLKFGSWMRVGPSQIYKSGESRNSDAPVNTPSTREGTIPSSSVLGPILLQRSHMDEGTCDKSLTEGKSFTRKLPNSLADPKHTPEVRPNNSVPVAPVCVQLSHMSSPDVSPLTPLVTLPDPSQNPQLQETSKLICPSSIGEVETPAGGELAAPIRECPLQSGDGISSVKPLKGKEIMPEVISPKKKKWKRQARSLEGATTGFETKSIGGKRDGDTVMSDVKDNKRGRGDPISSTAAVAGSQHRRLQ